VITCPFASVRGPTLQTTVFFSLFEAQFDVNRLHFGALFVCCLARLEVVNIIVKESFRRSVYLFRCGLRN